MAKQDNVKLPENRKWLRFMVVSAAKTGFALPFEIEVERNQQRRRGCSRRGANQECEPVGCGFLSPIELKTNDIVAIRVAAPEGPVAVGRPPILF